ncbi:MAG: GNAT family N-acetyltransferase, partial [Promethearchaeia archaeon]
PKGAEISLLGALGCGSWLMRLVLEELEQTGEYEFVVVQATDNSVPFYENFGFIRVGAVAKYREKTPEQLAAIAAQMAAKKAGGAGGGLAGAGGAAVDKLKSKKRLGNDRDDDEVDLPDWLKGKRFKFFVGGGSGSAGKEFGKQPAVAGGGGALKVVIKMGTSAQKQQRDVRIDWEDHSDENVARRRAAGFVPYCHWTFPEQSVEDICPRWVSCPPPRTNPREHPANTLPTARAQLSRCEPMYRSSQGPLTVACVRVCGVCFRGPQLHDGSPVGAKGRGAGRGNARAARQAARPAAGQKAHLS